MFFYQFCFDYFTEALVIAKGRVFNFSRLKVCFSRVAFCCDFHGKKICFTGCFKDFFTGWIQFSREQNRFFSRVTKKFSRGKKKHCTGLGIVRARQSTVRARLGTVRARLATVLVRLRHSTCKTSASHQSITI